MGWVIEHHPLIRAGSFSILAICVMHFIQAGLLLYSSHAGDATVMAALLLGVRNYLGISDPIIADYVVITLMTLSASLAVAGALLDVGKIRVLLFVPQHFMLGVMAFGGLMAAWCGAYLDGTVKPWEHISADQIGIMTLFVIHSSAIMRRARYGIG